MLILILFGIYIIHPCLRKKPLHYLGHVIMWLTLVMNIFLLISIVILGI